MEALQRMDSEGLQTHQWDPKKSQRKRHRGRSAYTINLFGHLEVNILTHDFA